MQIRPQNKETLRSLAPQSAGESKIFWLNRDTLGMDGGQVGIFEQRDEICLGSFLQSHNGRRLETEISLNDK